MSEHAELDEEDDAREFSTPDDDSADRTDSLDDKHDGICMVAQSLS